MWTVTFPGKILSPNKLKHWGTRSRQNKKFEKIILFEYRSQKPNLQIPATIELTRIAPREYDQDNLVAAFKGIRDSISQLFFPDSPRGVGDNHPELNWKYSQRRGLPKEYKIEIEISTKV